VQVDPLPDADFNRAASMPPTISISPVKLRNLRHQLYREAAVDPLSILTSVHDCIIQVCKENLENRADVQAFAVFIGKEVNRLRALKEEEAGFGVLSDSQEVCASPLFGRTTEVIASRSSAKV
jgi:hypothetical protein